MFETYVCPDCGEPFAAVNLVNGYCYRCHKHFRLDDLPKTGEGETKHLHGTLMKVAEIQLLPPNYKKQHDATLRKLRRDLRKAISDGNGKLAVELTYELEIEKLAWRNRKITVN